MSRYLVTGGAGFIGSHIVERLVAQGEQVRVLDNLSSGRIENIAMWLNTIEWIHGDIRNEKTVKEVMDGVDFVLHQAALRSVPKSMTRAREFHDVNVTGTLNVLCAAHAHMVKKVTLASSSSVYGDVSGFPQQEGGESFAISPYACTKKLGEEYVAMYARVFGLPGVSLRYFNVFGPRQSLEDEYAVVVPKFITCLNAGDPLPIYGDGEQSRDFTFVSNVVDANLSACTADVGSGEVINVACGETHTLNELIEHLEVIMQARAERNYCAQRTGDVLKTQADIQRLRTLLRVSPSVDFTTGLRRTVASMTMSEDRLQ